MKKSNLTEEEKLMYATCFGILIVSIALLAFFAFDNHSSILPSAITGAAVYESESEYEKISSIAGHSENATRELALNALLQAEEDMQEMQEQGFRVAWVNDTLLEAKRYFNGGNYSELLEETEKLNYTESEKIKLLLEGMKDLRPVNYSLVIEKADAIAQRKAKAYELSDNIKVLQLRVDELSSAGMLDDESVDLFNSFRNEFENERYSDAEVILEIINQQLAEGTAESVLLAATYKAGKENIINFVKENYMAIVIILAVIIIISLVFYNRIAVGILKKSLKGNEIERNVLESLMKRAQEDYFSKQSITKSTYELKISHYKERMAEIKQKTPVLEAKLQRISKIGLGKQGEKQLKKS